MMADGIEYDERMELLDEYPGRSMSCSDMPSRCTCGATRGPLMRSCRRSPSCAKCGSGWLGGQHYFQYCSHSTVAKTVNDAV